MKLLDKVAGGWRPWNSSAGAAHTMDGPRNTNYELVITTDGVGKTVALATGIKLGAGRVIGTNLDSTNAAYFALGTSVSDAILNLNIVGGVATSGTYLPANAGVTEKLRGVGALMTHLAVATAVIATTPLVNIEQVV